jgi:hypothetical protein
MTLLHSMTVTLGLDPRARGAAARSSVTIRERAARRLILGSSPRMTAVGVCAALSLTACGQDAPKSSTPPSPDKTAQASASTAATPVAAIPADLETACREAVVRLAGQEGDAVEFQRQGTDAATVSWRAPVDGGRLTMNCKAGAGRVELSSNGRQMAMGLSADPATEPAKQEAR